MTIEEKYRAELAKLEVVKSEYDFSPEGDEKFWRQMLKVKSAYLALCMENQQRALQAK